MPKILYIDEKEELTSSVWETLKELVSVKKRSEESISTPEGSNFVKEVAEQTNTPPENKMIWKAADGTWKWVGVFTNSFRDNDIIPEIFSSKSHRRYVNAVDSGSKGLPDLVLWHEEAWKIGKASLVALDEIEDGVVFVIAGGDIDEDKAFVAEAISKRADEGQEFTMSHGIPPEEARRNPHDYTVFDEYWSEEITVLPVGKEANPLTSFGIIDKDMAINHKKRTAMMEVLGVDEEFIDRLEASNATKATSAKEVRDYKSMSEQDDVKENDMDEKELKEQVEETTPVVEEIEVQKMEEEEEEEEEEEKPEKKTETASDDFVASPLFADLMKSMSHIGDQLNTLQTAVENLGSRVNDVEKEKEEEVLLKESPSVTSFYDALTKGSAVSKDSSAEITEDDELLKSTPKEAKVEKTGPIGVSVPFLNGLWSNGQ